MNNFKFFLPFCNIANFFILRTKKKVSFKSCRVTLEPKFFMLGITKKRYILIIGNTVYHWIFRFRKKLLGFKNICDFNNNTKNNKSLSFPFPSQLENYWVKNIGNDVLSDLIRFHLMSDIWTSTIELLVPIYIRCLHRAHPSKFLYSWLSCDHEQSSTNKGNEAFNIISFLQQTPDKIQFYSEKNWIVLHYLSEPILIKYPAGLDYQYWR